MSKPEQVADGVWRITGGLPGKRFINVYFIEDDDGITIFDSGIAQMRGDIHAAAASLGGAKRLVLGHAHSDHRGSAALLDLPVYCHPAEQADAEGDGGFHYFSIKENMPVHLRLMLPRMLAHWDAGAVQIAGTLQEGDRVGEFQVIHVPGHAPGQIALFRERDRVAVSTDCFYTLDVRTFHYGGPRVPHPGVNDDTEQARASIRKLADLEPSVAWPGHANPVEGDVKAQLLAAAKRV